VQLIAEIKRRSPSGGVIAPGLSAAAQATAYRDGGAAAISVLTEPTEFGGTIEDLDAAKQLGLPLLRKDFIVDNVQIQEAAAHGASAVLLIVRALPPDLLAELHAHAASIGLECLVEVHTEDELAVAVAGGYPLIGVNSRDLETLEVHPGVTERVIPAIPSRAVAVYESGIRTRDDMERAAALGADAVLVGSALSASADPMAAVRGLCGVARRVRRAS
jgi:indole-3-glycerol phosphate synthase